MNVPKPTSLTPVHEAYLRLTPLLSDSLTAPARLDG